MVTNPCISVRHIWLLNSFLFQKLISLAKHNWNFPSIENRRNLTENLRANTLWGLFKCFHKFALHEICQIFWIRKIKYWALNFGQKMFCSYFFIVSKNFCFGKLDSSSFSFSMADKKNMEMLSRKPFIAK